MKNSVAQDDAVRVKMELTSNTDVLLIRQRIRLALGDDYHTQAVIGGGYILQNFCSHVADDIDVFVAKQDRVDETLFFDEIVKDGTQYEGFVVSTGIIVGVEKKVQLIKCKSTEWQNHLSFDISACQMFYGVHGITTGSLYGRGLDEKHLCYNNHKNGMMERFAKYSKTDLPMLPGTINTILGLENRYLGEAYWCTRPELKETVLALYFRIFDETRMKKIIEFLADNNTGISARRIVAAKSASSSILPKWKG